MFEQIFDGEKGSTSQMGNKQPMSDDTMAGLKVESHFIPERFYKKLGIAPKLAGAEKVNGRLAYRLEVELPGNIEKVMYFDAENGLKVKAVRTTQGGPNGQIVQTTEYLDYREVNGVKFSFLSKTTAGPQNLEFKTNTVEVNSGLSDEVFTVE